MAKLCMTQRENKRLKLVEKFKTKTKVTYTASIKECDHKEDQKTDPVLAG